MANFVCLNTQCSKEFTSRHSVAKYCTKRCAATVNALSNTAFLEAKIKYTDEVLLEHIHNWFRDTGKVPSSRDFGKSPDHPSPDTYSTRFGSWNNAIVLAGYEPHIKYPSSYFENQRNLVLPSMRFKIMNRDGFQCAYCGGQPKDGYVLHVDHKIPFSLGGTTTEDNLVTACILCNVGKSNTRPDGLMASHSVS